ncbi:DUF1203 domain-containing protein [Streptomyces sp. NBC_00249]|uniref:DUF1203 domain-containing protein n=1 Tax=Streptomyces sp. NBC_00249 TaxID=2975690 RepID=UPI002253BAE7|nr:DUF1203 domain-containing protein [Streptomyces sp. NBC_00249]MCX5198232.1 DUF1203 domain-containing protein [Streptomyces sp. NBC_00249]
MRLADDAGRPALPYEDPEGGAPLRCCLRPSSPGERIALVTYAPLRRWAAGRGIDPGAYDEQGPVFVHAAPCTPDPAAGHPFAHPGALRAVRRYDGAGHILGGRVLTLGEDGDAQLDAALQEAFADPRTVLAHVRAVEFGCFLYEVRRP